MKRLRRLPGQGLLEILLIGNAYLSPQAKTIFKVDSATQPSVMIISYICLEAASLSARSEMYVSVPHTSSASTF